MTIENTMDTLIMYRVPARSTEQLLELFDSFEGMSRDDIVRRLFNYCEDPDIQMLILSASREFVQSLLTDDSSGSKIGPEQLRKARTMAGYLSRMSSRCIPFGLLAGIGWGRVGETTDLTLPSCDGDTVFAGLSPYLGTTLLPHFGYLGEEHADPTIYQVRGRRRRYESPRNGTWRLSEVEGPEGNERLHKVALSPTEPNCVEDLLSKIVELTTSEYSYAASKILETVRQLSGPLTPNWSRKYDACRTSIDGLLGLVAPDVAGTTQKSAHLILCNRLSAGTVTIAEDLVEEIRVAAAILHRLSEPSQPPLMATFSSRFIARYGDAFVPVLEAIDPGCGVGYSGGEGFALEIVDGGLAYQSAGQNAGGVGVTEFLFSAAVSNKEELSIGSEWAGSGLDGVNFTVLGSAAHKNRFLLESVAIGDFRLLGRFAPDVAGLAEALKCRATARGVPGVIDAEVVYLPPGPDGNVARRSAIYDHEIVCYGRASKDTTAIPVNELWVGSDQGELRLWWPRAECWVRPHFSCAHNIDISAYPVYRFFGDLCRIQNTVFHWSWGWPLPDVKRLPAVTCGRVELSPRSWWLQKGELAHLHRLPENARASRLRELREELEIPRRVQAGLSDHFIEVDLENPVFVDVMLHKAKTEEFFTLRESRLSSTNTVMRAGQSYCNEIILGYSPKLRLGRVDNSKMRKPPNALFKAATSNNWVTLKIYGERTQLEALLVKNLAPWVEEQMKLGFVDKWHFLRYGDPRGHLRFRFSGARTALPQAVGGAYELLDGTEFSVDGYSPEIGRYGGQVGMEICESVFMVDSRMATAIVRVLPKDLAVKRWEFCIGVLDGMLDAADMSTAERVDLCTRMRDGYAAKFGMDMTQVRRTLDSSYRTRRDRIEHAIVSARGSANRAAYESIMKLAQLNGALDLSVADIVSSLMHMHLNRVLGVSQMPQEIVIYDYLRRHYRSESAKSRGT
jgi:thiopeptide-type bacteriocin biosynthesis protein